MGHHYPLKAKPKTDVIEDESLKIFNNLVNFARLDFINQGGKVVSFDGQVRLLDKKRRPEIVSLGSKNIAVDTKYQIKGTEKKKQAYSFDVRDLSAYELEGKPVFVFLVNIDQKIVYYEVINDKYIRHVLGLDLQKLKGRKTKTVNFRKQFTGNTVPLLADFIACENIGESAPKDASETEDATLKEITEHKKVVGTAISTEVVFDIEAFLFLFPLGEGDAALKEKLCAKLEFRPDDFDFYARQMLKKGIIVSAGGRLMVKDVKVAKHFLSELIDRKGVEFVYE